MNLNVLNKWTDKSFDGLLECLREILPEGNQCPGNYYQTSKHLCEVGLGYEKIGVCQYDCALFYGENANAVSCPVCKSSRYVRNQIPHKRLRWFPIKARLKRMFSSKHTSKDMRWHKEVRKNEAGILRHPADGDAWKHFDNVYPDFAADSRSVRMGLASDGFNPFSNMTSTYSLWPVILIPYNMPPWASPNGTNYLMSLLIPGPKSPRKDYDVFLMPLIEELKELGPLYDKMMELRGQHPPEELSDKEIMECVLGRDSVYLRGWGRSPSVTTSTSHRENIVGNQPTYEELLERLNDTTSCLNATNEQLSVVVDILRHNNLMAPPPPPPTDQASDENLRESPSISVRESQDDS
ncbi:uncharacterized protein LOC133800665 [Humulus lupulus]|uniref:uncharacterized protein LOC133800665 n=1 Tax=Humulus lupulus TaxID=3486 RepID=UPI002B40F8DC|nr:uncharacterized protein LOC133800665 [Humulus lupulus]